MESRSFKLSISSNLALAAMFALGVFATPCEGEDVGGWRRVRDLTVPAIEFVEDPPVLRMRSAPEGTVDLDFGLTNGLPVSEYGRIKELARGLDHDVDKCYRYVRDNIAYASYYGLLKGPERTLLDREGNELDQAFLLLALLRASGFPEAGIRYLPLTHTNGVLASHFRIPLRKAESGSDYNAADWLSVDASGTISDVFSRIRLRREHSGHTSVLVMEDGVPYVATDRFYVALPFTGGTYAMDPAFKPMERHPASNAAAYSGYSRAALLSAVGGTVSDHYVQNLSKSELASYLDWRVTMLRNHWAGRNLAARHFVGESVVKPRTDDDWLYFHGMMFGGSHHFLIQSDGVKNLYRARMTLKIDETVLASFFLDEIGDRALWIGFRDASPDYPRAVLRLDYGVVAIESAGSSSETMSLTISIGYWPGSVSHTYSLTRNTANVYAVPVGFGGDSPSGARKVAADALERHLAGGSALAQESRALSLSLAGQQWASQVAMCSRLRSQSLGYQVYNLYNVGIAGYSGAPFVDFGNCLCYFSNMTTEMDGTEFFASALEHAALDQLNGTSRPSVSTVRIIDAANAAGVPLYFATSNNFATVYLSLTNYEETVRAKALSRAMLGSSVLIPKSGQINVNGWRGYGYVLHDNADGGTLMAISGGLNGGYGTVNAPPVPEEYRDRTSTILTHDGSLDQPMSADPVAMPDGAYYDAVTDLSVPGGMALSWTRHYDSRTRWRSGDLGRGWFHGFEASVSEVSDPDATFGSGSVEAVLPTAVANVVVNDLLNGNWGVCTEGEMARRWTLAAMVAQWWTERTTGASVVITLGARSLRFSRRPNGVYVPSPGVKASLSRTPGGIYTLSERHGSTYVFNGGRLMSITDPSGNVTSLTYSDGQLTRVENGFGASLSLTWSDGRVSRVTDSVGRSVSYSYDSGGKLVAVDDVRGKRTTFAYDPVTSALMTKTDPLGNVLVRNACNAFGQVTNQVSDAGGTWTFGYCRSDASWDEAPDGGRRTQAFDTDGRMTLDQTRDGGWSSFAYDGHGHVVCLSNLFGRVETRTYGADDLQLSSAINADGHGTAMAYDARLRVSEVTNAVGGVTRFTYDNCHRVVLTVWPDGSAVSNEWTSAGLLSAQTVLAPDGSAVRRTVWLRWSYVGGLPTKKTVYGMGLSTLGVSESYAYDAARRMVAQTDANGHVTAFTYDAAGNVLTRTAPDGAVTSFAYDDANRLVSSTDALGRTTSFTWTPSGRLSSTTAPDGSVTTNRYDANDRLVAATDARGATMTFEYDEEGRCVRRTGPAGTSSCRYNSIGLPYVATNAVGGVTLTSYSAAYTPVVTSNMAGRALWTAYDGLDRAVATSNAVGKLRYFDYDQRSRRTASIRPSGATDAFGYDTLGNCIAYTNAEGRVYRMSYDALGRMTAATNALGEQVFAATYDGVGNMTARTDGAGRTVTFAYGPCDRLLARTASGGTDAFAYDLAGNMTSASNAVAHETFAYDVCDRLTNAVTEVGGVAFTNGWSRDAGGLVTNVVYGAGKAVERTYDLAGRLVSVRDWLGHEWTFAWDAASHPTGGVSPDGTAHAFTYDPYGNLTAWSVADIAGRTVERDVEGRRLKDTVTAGPMPSARLRRNAQNAYDAADRLVAATVSYGGASAPVAETYAYDGSGAMTNAASGGVTVFEAAYDAQGRLASLGGPPSPAAAFAYDALGNRILVGGRIFVPDHSDPLKRPLIECDADGTPLRYYIWGPGRLLGFIDVGRAGSPLPADVLTIAHSDEQGSVIALTGEDGTLLWRACYGPHGEDWGVTGTNDTPFAWLGGCGVMDGRVLTCHGRDASDGAASAFGQLYLTRHRLYSPVLRRFLSADLMGIDGGLNLYAYASGNPLAYIDPLGLCAMTSLGGFFEMIGGVAEDFATGFVAGDFADGLGWGGTAGQIVGGLVPIYGQIADARDTAANARNVWNNPGSGEAWLGLGMSAVAWVPGIGDAAKGSYRAARRSAIEIVEGQTEIVQRAMSHAEVKQIAENGVLSRGGRPGDHYVSDAVNSTANRARQRLGLPVQPEARATLEVPKGVFSAPTRVKPYTLPNGQVLPGGGMERIAPGNMDIPARLINILEY